MLNTAKTALAAILLLASPAAAEIELSLYLGVQSVDDSTVSGALPNGTAVNRKFSWKGNPLENPYYYGARATWWTANNLGFGIEGTHTKAYASNADMAAIGTSRFELSDGHNIITANVLKRWPDAFGGSKFTPYVGAGLGMAIPHVDIQVIGSTGRTFDYEATGIAARGIAGMKYSINDRWALFGEYQVTWSDNDITVDPDPAVPGQTPTKLRTDLFTHAVNFGVSYSF
ncbi:porin family protein [Pseudohalocynthiibacter aestuariivivens]|uniref:Porin family protein n=1 Tax=Roseovarius pelagicus TaxID=2980108 RepID=A0ABY6D7V2_9RHOB|nr:MULTISPECIES: outer membrane beta-barrel protein [Rhodobacterales]QIE45830.1 porin family protein [Pseudohalocynthiibacter aestuariivivens]UXX82221.1 porin family protein [Roseovarius pelagicus]